MNFQASVVVRKKNEWLIGKIDGFKFTALRKIKKLKDVEGVSDYKPLKDFMVENGKHPKFATILLKETGLDSIYILDRPSYYSAEETEEMWWNEYSEKCEKCSKSCKQSKNVLIYTCPDYQVA